MLKSLKALAKARESTGALSGKQITVGSRVVKVERLLGEGGFATIYRCTDADTGETFALKHFILTGYPEAARDADQEVAVMERLSGCPCVVRLHEAALAGPPGAPTAAFALMDFCPDTLVAFLQQRAWQLDDEELLRVALPVARAVQAMHSLSPPLAHRDLKAENILRGPSGRWVLCDFGSCSARHGVLQSARDIALEEEVVRKYTTPAYRAPELYDLYAREYVGPPVDIWALGVLLYLLAFGRLPFEGEAKLQVLNGRYIMPEGRAPALRALIADMLRVAPRERPTVHEVLSRLAAMAPPHLLGQLPDMQGLAGGPPRAAAPAASGTASAPAQQQQAQQQAAAGWGESQHERAPSQGWADFAAESALAGAAASSVHARQESGSSSWATFSPKRGDDGQAAAPAASAGSFWSSFGEEVPGDSQQEAGGDAPAEALLLHEDEESASPRHQPLLAPREAHAPRPQPAQQPQHHSQSAPHRLVAAAAAAAASVASTVTRPLEAARTPPPAQAAPQPAAVAQPTDASPLSAGLSRMSRVSQSGEASVAKPPAPTPSTAWAPAPTSGAGSAAAQRQAGLGTAPTLLSSSGARQPSISEAEALRQHSLVLEELLESRKDEIERLQRLVEQQGLEIKRLRQQLQAAQQALHDQQQQAPRTNGTLADATPVQSTGTATSAVAATPASSRLGQAPRLEVPDSGTASGASSPSSRAEASPWVSFTAAGGGRDAPTPTLLQPAGGNAFAGSSSSRLSSESARPAAAGVGGGAAVTPASGASMAPLEEQFRSKLDLSLQRSGSSNVARAASGELQRHKPMRSGSGTAAPPAAGAKGGPGQPQQAQHAALRSFPVPLTPGAPALNDGPRSAPSSAQPSPLRAAAQTGLAAVGRSAGAGAAAPAQPGSPLHSALGAARSGSPSKHRRNMTAPDGGFFEDLNPLQQ